MASGVTKAEKRSIWKGAEGALFEAPAVSSDGRVAIVLRRQGKRLLHIMSADGSGLRPLTDALDICKGLFPGLTMARRSLPAGRRPMAPGC